MKEIVGAGRAAQTTTSDWLSRIQERLWPNGFRADAWMIVDCARDDRIYALLLECFYSRHACLYSGSIGPSLQMAAPYLIQLEYDDRKTQRFVSQAWGHSWGVFLKCDTQLETLRRHLRTLLVVGDENGNRLLFRYYDPRILRIYLPTCTAAELRTVFGPVTGFFMEGERPDLLMEFSFAQNKLESQTTLLPRLS